MRLSAEKVEALGELMTVGGVQELWAAWQAEASAELQRVTEREGAEEFEIYEAASYQRSPMMPLWWMAMGFRPDQEFGISPGERARCVTRFLRRVERMVRAELKSSGFNGTAGQASSGTREEEGAETDGEADRNLRADSARDGRVGWWDPVRSVCFYLRMSASKLGAYAREFWGLGGQELADRVKAESLRARLKVELKERLLRADDGVTRGEQESEVDVAVRRVRAQRKAEGWERSGWAARLGFSSNTKLSRACLMVYGLTPSELEREILEDLLTEPGAEMERRDADAAHYGMDRRDAEAQRTEGRGAEMECVGAGDGGRVEV